MTHHITHSILFAQQAGGGLDISLGGILAAAMVPICIGLAVFVLIIACYWKIFAKAGKPGWAAIVPFYNMWVLVEVCQKSPVWFVLLFVPCVGQIIGIMLVFELAKVFGKGGGFAVGLLLLGIIFLPLLAFGDAQYQPSNAAM